MDKKYSPRDMVRFGNLVRSISKYNGLLRFLKESKIDTVDSAIKEEAIKQKLTVDINEIQREYFEIIHFEDGLGKWIDSVKNAYELYNRDSNGMNIPRYELKVKDSRINF